jgi:hypothetical protein
MGFKKHTVFIVGAGAHVDYGMPTGAQLREAIVTPGNAPSFWVDHPRQWQTIREVYASTLSQTTKDNLSTADQDMFDIQRALGGSTRGSIDDFLSHHSILAKPGTLMVAGILLALERRAALADQLNGWYSWLYRKLEVKDDASDPLALDRCSIITFNYDRLAELILTTLYLNSTDQRSHTERLNGVAASGRHIVAPDPIAHFKKSIYHVYGALESKPIWSRRLRRFETDDIVNPDKYDLTQNCTTLQGSANSIRLMHPARSMLRIQREVSERLRSAARIVFVGFGFDPFNVNLLGLNPPDDSSRSPADPPEIFSTGYGLQESQRQKIASDAGVNIVWGGEQQSCVEFLESLDL